MRRALRCRLAGSASGSELYVLRLGRDYIRPRLVCQDIRPVFHSVRRARFRPAH